jgi:glucans biosynthesis protein
LQTAGAMNSVLFSPLLFRTSSSRISRFWRFLLSCIAVIFLLWAAPAEAFNFTDVAQRAEKLASSDYKKPVDNLPKELQTISYDKYRDIRFKPEKSLWRNANLPFELAFFHQGLYFNQPVKINEITGPAQDAREIKFDPNNFNYGANKLDPKLMEGLGFAGFRVHYPINTPKYKDEVTVFLGASYFRALGKGQVYGLSARGLAIDTALSSGEEFPRFVEFWVERPGPNAKELTIYGLLDSPRATGAYRFVLKPGSTTTMDVTARLFLRSNVGKLGIAPLTSMMFFGENQRPITEDYRPEVHDSDGLSVHTADEWIWRPLANPKRLLVTSFTANNPQGFGLMQRDRVFDHYEDLEARYDVRPSAWIEPKGDWGAGRVEVVQIPVTDETNDNVVAYWVPDNPPKPKEAYNIEYRVSWQKEVESRSPLSSVVQSRRGQGYRHHPENSVGFVLDFDGPALRKLAADAKPEGAVSLDANGQLLESTVYRNAVTGGWRQMLRVKRVDPDKPIELRSYLKNAGSAISETWSYILPPE